MPPPCLGPLDSPLSGHSIPRPLDSPMIPSPPTPDYSLDTNTQVLTHLLPRQRHSPRGKIGWTRAVTAATTCFLYNFFVCDLFLTPPQTPHPLREPHVSAHLTRAVTMATAQSKAARWHRGWCCCYSDNAAHWYRFPWRQRSPRLRISIRACYRGNDLRCWMVAAARPGPQGSTEPNG